LSPHRTNAEVSIPQDPTRLEAAGNLANLRATADHDPGLLGGVTVVTADGRTRGAEDVVRLTAVPYYAWANRRPGAMRVWIPRE